MTANTQYGYKGKQVRDNIHSEDVVRFIDCFLKLPDGRSLQPRRRQEKQLLHPRSLWNLRSFQAKTKLRIFGRKSHRWSHLLLQWLDKNKKTLPWIQNWEFITGDHQADCFSTNQAKSVMPSSICLSFVFNHKYEKNIPKLKKIYKERFSTIRFLSPFSDWNEDDIIPIYDLDSFSGCLPSVFSSPKDFDYHAFLQDDLILNPQLNEENLIEKLNCTARDI